MAPVHARTEERDDIALKLADAIQTWHEIAPSMQATPNEWARRFREFGFFRATQVAATLNGSARMLRFVSFADMRPSESTTIFRVCSTGREKHISWTPMLSQALNYAPGGEKSMFVTHDDARLFSAVVHPADVLAVLNDFEWVVDSDRLEGITDHGPVKATLPTISLSEVKEQPEKAELIALLGPDYPVQMTDGDPYLLSDSRNVAATSEPVTASGRGPTPGPPLS